MNRNDYRRALIMLRSLKGGASGYVRLERRTLAGTLQFTLNSAPTDAELYAILLYRKNGTWYAVKADAFGAPRYGQVGMVWSFDPRNIGGRTLEQYDLTAIVEKRGSTCEPILCGNLNGSVDADFSQIRAAVCRLFTPVRISTPVPAIPERTAPQTDHTSDAAEIPSIDLYAEEIDRSAAEQSDHSEPAVSEAPISTISCPCDTNAASEPAVTSDNASENCNALSDSAESAAQAVLSQSVYPAQKEAASPDIAPIEADEFDTPAAAPIESDDLDTPADAPVEPDEFDIPAVSAADNKSKDCTASADLTESDAQAVLSRSVYPAQKETASSDASPIEADEFDTPAVAPTEVDDLDTPADIPIEPDEFDTPAATPIESDDLDTPADAPVEPDEFDIPAVSTADSESKDCTASADLTESAAQAVLSRSVYPAQKEAASPDAAPIEADEFDTPAAAPIESDDFDTPADNRLTTPAHPASVVEEDIQTTPPAQPDTTVQAPTAGEQLNLLDPHAAWHASIEPLHQLFFSQEAIVPFEAEGYVFIRAPLHNVENTGSCLIGLYCEDGVPARVCYAIPAEYTPEPPAGMEGYVWRGSHTRGYWVICEGVPSA